MIRGERICFTVAWTETTCKIFLLWNIVICVSAGGIFMDEWAADFQLESVFDRPLCSVFCTTAQRSQARSNVLYYSISEIKCTVVVLFFLLCFLIWKKNHCLQKWCWTSKSIKMFYNFFVTLWSHCEKKRVKMLATHTSQPEVC